MMVGEGNKVQLREPSRGPECMDGSGVRFVPPGSIDVVMICQVIEILNQTATEAHLQEQATTKLGFHI